jgi:hypothetical protein
MAELSEVIDNSHSDHSDHSDPPVPELPTAIDQREIDFGNVYANEIVSGFLTASIDNRNNYLLAERAVKCIPLLVEGTTQWLGHSNVSTAIIRKLVKMLRQQRSGTHITLLALLAITDLCVHEPIGKIFTEFSTIKILVKVIEYQLKKRPQLMKQESLLLRRVVQKWQRVMNIDNNVTNHIAQYLFSQKRSDYIVHLCCELIAGFAVIRSKKVAQKISSTSGLNQILIDVLGSSSSIKVKLKALVAMKKLGIRRISRDLIHNNAYEQIIAVIRDNVDHVAFVKQGIEIISELLEMYVWNDDEPDWKPGDASLLETGFRRLLNTNACQVLHQVITSQPENTMIAWQLTHQIAYCSRVSPSRTATAELKVMFQEIGIADALHDARLLYPNHFYLQSDERFYG